ncbi:MAG TPA: transglycosylase domain-containing protein [Gaiellaceae bacterium]|nr:transglycosylase domain-containing protein [Gaiellaceae bacterium]
MLFGALLVAAGAALAAGAVTAVNLVRTHCDLDVLRPVVIGQNSFVYAADGTSLGAIPAEKNRQPVPLSEISPWMRRATIAVEDRRFYRHGGVDYEGIARALWRDLTEGKVVEGGSTLTQQLVRNIYISRERTVGRKLREACLAVQLNRKWSKQRILRAWLNTVYFGNRSYGVEAASQTYFGKRARHLNLREAALLAGLPQAPSAYDPFVDPAVALARRNTVLQAMLDNDDITPAQHRWAVSSSNLRLRPGKLYTTIREPYFFGYVRDELIDHYGANTVRSGGLKVYTTINPRFQRAAEISIRETLDQPGDPASAVVSINPANGAIRAMTSVTPGRKGNQFNLVSQARRQAGSTFKMFVLAAAVLKKIDPSSTSYVSAPFYYQPDPNVPAWEVSTYSHSYSGWTSIRSATIASDNTVFAQLTVDVGPEHVAATARRMGVRTPLLPVPSLGLGSIAISPLDLASGYATLAGRGVYSRPMAIRKVILRDGREDTGAGWGNPVRRRVMSEGEAYVITKILEENIQYGTGTGAAIGRTAAGKTGTTDDHADAWFAGYTPDLTTVVWVGYPQGEIPMESVHGISVSGGSFPADIWRRYMQRAVGTGRPLEWVVPDELPDWEYWERGEHVLSYDPYAAPEKTEETTTEEQQDEEAEEQAEDQPPPPPPTFDHD